MGLFQQSSNRSNKLEYYIILSWKGLGGANSLAFWVWPKVTNKIKCCAYGPASLFDGMNIG